MDLLQSLDNIDNYWDQCMGDEEFKQRIESSANFRELRKELINEVDTIEKDLLEQYLQPPIIQSISNGFPSFVDQSNILLRDVKTSMNLLHAIDEINKSGDQSLEQIFYMDMLQLDAKLHGPLEFHINLDNLQENHMYNRKVLKDIEQIRKTLQKYPGSSEFFGIELQEFRQKMQNNCKTAQIFIKDVVKQNYTVNDVTLFRGYFNFLATEPGHSIPEFQRQCVKEAARSLFERSFPPAIIFTKVIKMVDAVYNKKQFDYRHPGVMKLLSYSKNDPIPLDVFTSDMMDHVEFRILKFIVELPSIVPDTLAFLNSILYHYQGDDKEFQKIFQNELYKQFFDYLNSPNVFNARSLFGQNRNDIQTPMFWCFLHRIAAYHETSVPTPKEPYTQFIMNMLRQTTQVCKTRCNQLFEEYNMTKTLNDSFNIILHKYQKAGKTPESQITFINSFVSLYEESILPVFQQGYLFYDAVVAFRDLNTEWYSFMLETLLQNKWFIEYYNQFQKLPVFEAIVQMKDYVDEQYVPIFLCKALRFPQFVIIKEKVKRLFQEYIGKHFKQIKRNFNLYVFTSSIRKAEDATTVITQYNDYIHEMASIISTILTYANGVIDSNLIDNLKNYAIDFYTRQYTAARNRCISILPGQEIPNPQQFAQDLVSQLSWNS